MQHTHLLTPDSDPMRDQNTDTMKIQCGQPVSFIEVTYRTMDKELQEQKWLKDITQAYPSMGDISQKLETWSTLQGLW